MIPPRIRNAKIHPRKRWGCRYWSGQDGPDLGNVPEKALKWSQKSWGSFWRGFRISIRNRQEGLQTKMAESRAIGTPVVASTELEMGRMMCGKMATV
jgi:hypothetical protein